MYVIELLIFLLLVIVARVPFEHVLTIYNLLLYCEGVNP